MTLREAAETLHQVNTDLKYFAVKQNHFTDGIVLMLSTEPLVWDSQLIDMSLEEDQELLEPIGWNTAGSYNAVKIMNAPAGLDLSEYMNKDGSISFEKAYVEIKED